MTRNLYIGFISVLFVCMAGLCSCDDEEDFDNKPQLISVNSIEITPRCGALLVEWAPSPEDTNFVFLNVRLTDQDGQVRNYNVSRYNSQLADKSGTATSAAASLLVDRLVNREYSLEFYAFNDQNNAISLGSRRATPLDYREVAPDSITDLVITGVKKAIMLEWREPEVASWTTYKGVRFIVTNMETGAVTTKEYPVGIRHDSLAMDPGLYTVAIETFSELGKTNRVSSVYEVEVRLADEVELFDKASRAGWKLDADSEEATEGKLEYIIDGDATTYWHSTYSTANKGRDNQTMPYFITVELDKMQHIGGFLFQQRHNDLDRHITDYKIYCKKDVDDEWEEVFSGSLKNIIDRQDAKLRMGVEAKFVKLEILSGTGGNLVSLAEFGLIVFEE